VYGKNAENAKILTERRVKMFEKHVFRVSLKTVAFDVSKRGTKTAKSLRRFDAHKFLRI